ncbi:MAG: hypothetical protein FWD55_08360 [Propionibacteriaceae bacterium]|nr:hypothetical protein [Propionibacteriaceae bacterium]
MMGRSIAEATMAVGRVRAMPFGRARAEAAAQQARLIEVEGPDEVLAYALESLVEALTWMGESDKALVPFIRLLRWWDTHPEHFDTGDQNILFWEFGWIINDLSRTASVPIERVDRTLDDMERRFRLANRGMERVWNCRLEWDMIRGSESLEKTFTTWLTMPIDEEDSCPACHKEHHANYLIETGDLVGGAAVLETALSSELKCSREPASILSMLVWTYMQLGQFEEAENVLPKALAEMKSATSMSILVSQSRLFESLAAGRNPEKALSLLNKIEEGVATATQYIRLETLRHLLVGAQCLVEQGCSEQEIESKFASTIAEFASVVDQQAQELSDLFDARHQTNTQALRLARVRAQRSTSHVLKLEQVELTESQGSTHMIAAFRDKETDLETWTRAERAFKKKNHKLAASLYRVAADEAEKDARLAEAGWCWAEAARNTQALGETMKASRDYVQAQIRLKAAGISLEEIAPMFIAWAPAVDEQDYRTFVDLALQDYPTPAKPACADEIEDFLGMILAESMVHSPLMRKYVLARANLTDAVARVMATWGDAADKESAMVMAQESATRFSTLGRTDAAAHSWWLAGKIAAHLDNVNADANYSMALQGFKSTGQRNEGIGAQAAQDYADYLTKAGRAKKARKVLNSWAQKEE